MKANDADGYSFLTTVSARPPSIAMTVVGRLAPPEIGTTKSLIVLGDRRAGSVHPLMNSWTSGFVMISVWAILLARSYGRRPRTWW